MSKKKKPKSEVIALTAHLDNYHINDIAKLPLQELRNKCSFLVSTNLDDTKIGVSFRELETKDGAELIVSVVKETFAGARAVPLDHVKTEYRVLQLYGIVGDIAMQFTQRMLNWGEFKQAISDLAGAEVKE